MKCNPEVLLVDPPKEPWWLLGETVMPPLGLLYIASYLKSKDVDVALLDCQALGYSWRDLRSALETIKPSVVGVGGPTCYSYKALEVCRISKEVDPSITTVVGGPHFTFTAEETLAESVHVDFVVRGEGEETMYELVKALLQGGLDVKKIKGLSYRDDLHVRHNPPRPLIRNIDEIPMPDWSLLPMDKYKLVAWGSKAIMTLSSRGCPFKCNFCSEWMFWGGVWRPHSPQRVVNELEHLNKRYGKEVFWFADDTFNVDRGRLIAICREILDRGLNVHWGFEGRADLILRDLDILELMRNSGLFWVLVGVEASTDEELRSYNKGLTIRQVENAFKALKEHDIITQAMFIVGSREDDEASIKSKLKFALKLDPDFVIFTPLTPLPGTQLYEEAVREGWLSTRDYSKFDFAHAVLNTKHLSSRDVDELMIYCYRKFYNRPIKTLKGLLSRNRFRRAINAYFLKFFLKRLLAP